MFKVLKLAAFVKYSMNNAMTSKFAKVASIRYLTVSRLEKKRTTLHRIQ